MTITDISNVKTYTGNNSTTAFSSVFIFFDSTDIVVTVDGTTKVLNTDYTVSGGAGSTGTITFNTAPATDAAIIFQRVVAYEQQTDFANFDGNPSDVTEKQFDLLVMQTQQLRDASSRSLTVPVGSSLSLDLPTPSAGKTLKWNSGEDGLENSTYDPDTQQAAAAASATAAASSAAAAATSAASISSIVNTIESSGNAITVDLDDGRVFKHTFTENTTFTFSNPEAAGTETLFVLYLINDGTGRTPTWPAAVIWPYGNEPDLTTASEKNVLVFSTIDGGTTWYGSLALEAMS